MLAGNLCKGKLLLAVLYNGLHVTAYWPIGLEICSDTQFTKNKKFIAPLVFYLFGWDTDWLQPYWVVAAAPRT